MDRYKIALGKKVSKAVLEKILKDKVIAEDRAKKMIINKAMSYPYEEEARRRHQASTGFARQEENRNALERRRQRLQEAPQTLPEERREIVQENVEREEHQSTNPELDRLLENNANDIWRAPPDVSQFFR
jgi:hypothetical protein